MFFVSLCLVSFIHLLTQDARAQINEIRVDQIDNSPGGAALDGFVTNDVSISFDGRYTGSQLLVQLDEGTIYQDPRGANTTPNFATASVRYDTFVAQGLPTIGDINAANPDGGLRGAVNLGGEPDGSFDILLIDIAWFPQPPQFLEDLSDLLTARVTLSEDAVGSWAYLASAQGEITIENRIIQGGVVQNGAMLLAAASVPEPGTFGLAALALGVLLGGRSMKQRMQNAPR
jgi:hypothetical protein